MNFNYKNLSKSLLVMLMPALIACGGKTNGAKDNSSVHKLSFAETFMHKADSVQILFVRANAAEGEYRGAFHEIEIHHSFSKQANDRVLAKYQKDKLRELEHLADSCSAEADRLKSEFYTLSKVIGKNRRVRTESQELEMKYNRIVVEQKCCADVFVRIQRDLEHNPDRTGKLATYQVKQMNRLAVRLNDLRLAEDLLMYKRQKSK